MQIFYSTRAAKQLEFLPINIQKRIAKKMRFFAAYKDPLKFAERLTDYLEGSFRFRIGDYRVAFDVVKGDIYVLKIKKRDKAYD